jgi:hypothetical protein
MIAASVRSAPNRFVRLGHLALWSLAVYAATAHGHSGGISYVELESTRNGWRSSIDLPLPDAAVELDLDADRDGALRWSEVVSAQNRITNRIAERMRLQSGTAHDCAARIEAPLELMRRASGTHLRIHLHYTCNAGAVSGLHVDASAWFAEVPDHGLLLHRGGGGRQIAMLKADNATLSLEDAGGTTDAVSTARQFLVLGVEHLLTGYDHLAFLALLLIGVLRSAGANRRALLLATATIVTAFTVAHSLSLALAALGVVRIPGPWVEAAIAASILATAATMALRRDWRPDWRVAFGVGLVHGLGFASLLGELLDGRASVVPLAAFNLGLELAQLGLVLAVLPVLTRLARWPTWEPRLAPVFTWLLAAGGGVWLWQRL